MQSEDWTASGGSVDPGDEGEADWTAPAQQENDRTYTVSVRVRYTNGCDESDSVQFTVEGSGPPPPPPDPCENASVTAPSAATMNTGAPGNGAASQTGFPPGSGSWSISENPSWISIASNGVVTWRPSGAPDATYGYTVEYTRGGCSDSDSSSVTVTRFTPEPCPVVSLSGGGTVQGGSENLVTWSDDGGATVQSEDWTASGGSVDPGDEGEADWTAPAQQENDRTYTVSVRVRYTNGCDESDSPCNSRWKAPDRPHRRPTRAITPRSRLPTCRPCLRQFGQRVCQRDRVPVRLRVGGP